MDSPLAKRKMRRLIASMMVLIATAAAVSVAWLWALKPLGFASYLTSTPSSKAAIIRQYWPHRLVEPEWVSPAPDRILNWHMAETLARLSVVGAVWLFLGGAAMLRFIRAARTASPSP